MKIRIWISPKIYKDFETSRYPDTYVDGSGYLVIYDENEDTQNTQAVFRSWVFYEVLQSCKETVIKNE